MRALPATLALLAALSGCLAATPGACPVPAYASVTYAPGALGTVDPRQPIDVPYILTGLAPGANATVRATSPLQAAPVAFERTAFGSNVTGQHLERLRFQPTDLAPGLDVRWDVRRAVPPGCDPAGGGLVHNLGADAREGRLLTPGHGAHVWYAGFWENGTLFETNIEAFDHSAWPKAAWYEHVPYEPLPVYVYDQSRSEQPAYWKAPSQLGRTGTPVDGPLAAPLGAATQASGAGYYSTIKGFNDALKGLSTAGARVSWMAAADAYPAGTPGNPLAGDNLVFFVRLADVVDAPCPAPQATGALPCPSQP